jgi:ABC-type nitrate/sulfonate/bicarbonate transport system substrate-binding protein
MRLKRWLTSLLVLFLGYTTPSFAQPAELVPIRLQLTWSHQAQFAGVYVAQIRKHFAAAGIDLIVFPGGPCIKPH